MNTDRTAGTQGIEEDHPATPIAVAQTPAIGFGQRNREGDGLLERQPCAGHDLAEELERRTQALTVCDAGEPLSRIRERLIGHDTEDSAECPERRNFATHH